MIARLVIGATFWLGMAANEAFNHAWGWMAFFTGGTVLYLAMARSMARDERWLREHGID